MGPFVGEREQFVVGSELLYAQAFNHQLSDTIVIHVQAAPRVSLQQTPKRKNAQRVTCVRVFTRSVAELLFGERPSSDRRDVERSPLDVIQG